MDGIEAKYLSGCEQIGLRGLLAAHASDVFELPVSNLAVLSDMDCPEDYQRELARLRQEDGFDGRGQ